ncbi:MAG: hypothetical protein TU36_004840 [Vulcanisaeta sp. AZ3]|jgi:predicted DNA-binding transcriptional regulator|nr:MAG: hypothetical protein TU36_02160 [Vulcanisaeta sp. AZ3]
MSVELAKKVLEDWFSKRGLRLEYEGGRELVFLEGNNKVYIRVSNEEFPTESQIIDELSDTMKNRLSYNKAYIAFPVNARGLINGKLFRSHWVGVYLYDLSTTDPDKAVEELIPSIPIQTQQGSNEEVMRRLGELEVRINELRNNLNNTEVPQSLIKEIEELRSRLMRIEGIISDLLNRVNKLENSSVVATTQQSIMGSAEGSTTSNLPDFLSNNPWINVIRKRGEGNG